jgi:hypothetical protein
MFLIHCSHGSFNQTLYTSTIANILLQEPLIGYECIHPNSTIEKFSLVDIQPCSNDLPRQNNTNLNIQILQQSKLSDVTVYRCKIEIIGHVFHCGIYDHMVAYRNGFIDYFPTITSNECEKVIKTGSIRINGQDFTNVKANQSTQISFDLGIYGDDDCSDYSSFWMNGIQYNDAVGSFIIKFDISQETGIIDPESNKIKLSEKLQCNYLQETCTDLHLGQYFWSLNAKQGCIINNYKTLYQGPAIRHDSELSQGGKRTSYVVDHNEYLFALNVREYLDICGYPGYQSDHPSLIIVEYDKHNNPRIPKMDDITTFEVDLLLYFNSKFVYVEKKLISNINENTHLILRHICEIERKILYQQLSIASLNPTEFAYLLKGVPGYLGVNAGEQVFVIGCQPVPVRLRATPKCYSELPIIYGNNITGFLSPKSHLITDVGTEMDCSNTIFSAFHINRDWLQSNLMTKSADKPNYLKPQKMELDPIEESNLALRGLYSYNKVQSVMRTLYYGRNRDAMISTSSRLGFDEQADVQNYNVGYMITPDQVKSAIRKYWDSLTSFTDLIGHYTSVGVGLYVIYHILAWVVSTIARSLSIYQLTKDWKQIIYSLTSCITDHYNMKLHMSHHQKMNTIDTKLIELSNQVHTTEPKELTSAALYPTSFEV